jgi:hypothetical protein
VAVRRVACMLMSISHGGDTGGEVVVAVARSGSASTRSSTARRASARSLLVRSVHAFVTKRSDRALCEGRERHDSVNPAWFLGGPSTAVKQ